MLLRHAKLRRTFAVPRILGHVVATHHAFTAECRRGEVRVERTELGSHQRAGNAGHFLDQLFKIQLRQNPGSHLIEQLGCSAGLLLPREQ